MESGAVPGAPSLEPTQSAPTSLLLQAKKHAHVVAKSQGIDNSSRWSRSGGQEKAGLQRKRKRKREEGQRARKEEAGKAKIYNWWQGDGGWSDKQNWWEKEKEKKGDKKEDAKKADK